MNVDLSKVEEIIGKHNRQRAHLIAILHEIQDEYNYLPAEALKRVAGELRVSEIEVLGVASFYKSFSLSPRGRHLVNICMGTACHVRGAPKILEEAERRLGIKAGETTEDCLFTLKTVNCVGACAMGPIIVVDDEYHGHMRSDRVGRLLKKISGGTK